MGYGMLWGFPTLIDSMTGVTPSQRGNNMESMFTSSWVLGIELWVWVSHWFGLYTKLKHLWVWPAICGSAPGVFSQHIPQIFEEVWWGNSTSHVPNNKDSSEGPQNSSKPAAHWQPGRWGPWLLHFSHSSQGTFQDLSPGRVARNHGNFLGAPVH
jgi:hypothetical protein